MAELSIRIDKRRPETNKGYPVRLFIRHNNTVSSELLYNLPEKYFVGVGLRPVKSTAPASQLYNDKAEQTLIQYKQAVFELEQSGRIDIMTASDIKEYVKGANKSPSSFSASAEAYMTTIRAAGTLRNYQHTVNKLRDFSGKQTLSFEDVNLKFLREFDMWLERNGNGINTRSIHFRNMRAIFNRAIDDEVTTLYPFRKYKIQSVKKEIRAIACEQMREIYFVDLSGDDGLRIARDLFMFSFFLCGINPVDIFNLSTDEATHTHFIRAKIAQKQSDPVRILIQPEAAQIIERYKGLEHLLCFADNYADYDSFYSQLEKRMRRLSVHLGYKITMYTARYTWATIADSLDISEKTISKALGHADVSLTGKKYIAFDWNKVDVANRKVIDEVIYRGHDFSQVFPAE